MSAFFGLRSVFLFVFVVAGTGAILAVCAAAVRHGNNVFKQQHVAWIITIVMVAAAIGVGYAKAPVNNRPAPVPDYPAPTVPPVAVPEPVRPVAPVEGQSYVWDNANVLSDRTIQELDARNEVLWTWYSASIGVVTCDYGGSDLYDYALQCAEDMGLGGYDFTVVLDISGENYWLVQGDDIRRDFTDNDCADYAYDYMERDFARGNYDQAVLKLTEALGNWYEDYYD